GPLSYRPLPDRLFRNRGDGTFEDISTRVGIVDYFGGALGVIPADFNGDGVPDIYVANDGVPNQLWMGGKQGGFVNRGLISGTAVNQTGRPEASMGVVAADYDADGDEDLFMTHLIRETNTLYSNDGSGFFEDRSLEAGLARASWEYTGFGTVWIDFDNDGWLDLLAANGEVKVIPELEAAQDPYPLHQLNSIFRNRGDGTFEEVSKQGGAAFALSEVSRGIAVGDIDNDGDSDAVLTNNSGPVRLLLNQIGSQNHWVGLRLVGTDSERPRDMLGAWVGVFVEDRSTLWRRVNSAGSYASASDPRILVGLGDSESVDRVEVHWPGGAVEEWNVAIDRYSTLHQGTGKRVSASAP
ncbi:MAG: CRTAC1 family protein, partial [Thermoanaerobaculia bacterium]